MKIIVKADATSGKVFIPKGEYMATAVPDRGGIQLTGGGNDYLIPAVKRPVKVPTKIVKVQFYCLGGAAWTLAITLPNRGEWVSFLTLNLITTAGSGVGGGGVEETYEIDPNTGLPDFKKKKKPSPT